MMMMTLNEIERTPTRKIRNSLTNEDHPPEEIQMMEMMMTQR